MSNTLDPLDNDETKSSADQQSQQQMRNFANSMKGFRQHIQEALDEGESPKAIYDRMLNEYGDRYQRFFSRVIGGTPSKATVEENKSLHQLLMGLLLLFIGTFLLYQYRYFQYVEPSTVHFVGSGLFVVYFVFLWRQVQQFRGEALYSVLILMLVGAYYFYGESQKEHFESWMYIFFGLVVSIGGLSYYLKRKVFPNLKYGGPKKDANGEYIF